jgi:hypothetical protein
VIGELGALGDDGEQGAAPLVHERSLLDEPCIDVIEEQRRARGHVDQLAALGREISLPAEGGYQVALEGQSDTSAAGPRSARTPS